MTEELTKEQWVQKYNQAFEKAQQAGGGRDPKWQGVTCPTQDSEDCVLCNMSWPIVAKKNRDKYSQELVDKAFEFLRKSKYFVNIVRKEEPEKVYILEFPTTIFKKLSAAQMGGDEGGNENFFSFENGKNVVIIKTGKGRNTEYDVRFRERSKFPKSFAKMVWDLDNIQEIRAQDKNPIIRAAQLEEGPNEIRILPNWRVGEDVVLFFKEWVHHMGLSPEEFSAIQNGEFNPYGNVDYDEEPEPAHAFVKTGEEDIPIFADEVEDKEVIKDAFGPEERTDATETKTREETQADVVAETGSTDEATVKVDPNMPACAGSYETDDEECVECPHGKECLDKTRGK